jgi:hypothetical protein
MLRKPLADIIATAHPASCPLSRTLIVDMGPSNNDTDSVLEILDPGSCAGWLVAPGKHAEYPISIRNGTQDSHDIEVIVADPIDWVRVNPSRVALMPGSEALTTLTVAIPSDAQVAAGEHHITLELHDFEGTCFGQLVSSVNVEPIFRLEMSVAVRDPLVHREVVEGFILHCTLVNHGNSECAVETCGDGGGCIILHAPAVRVPMGGEVSFDIEARWTSNALPAYPATIVVRVVSPLGEARADVAWEDIARCLGPYVPPLQQEEEFPDIIPRPSNRVHTADQARRGAQAQEPSAGVSLERAGAPDGTSSTNTPSEQASQWRAPIRVQINGPSPFRSAYGRRINPWWPPAERLGARWRIKAAPFAVAFVTVAVAVGVILGFAGHKTTQVTPMISVASLFPVSLQRQYDRPPHSIVAISQPSGARKATQTGSHLSDLPRLPSGPPNGLRVASGAQSGSQAHRGASQHITTPKGSLWQGPVLHVSASNIKVYGTADKVERSFIVMSGFKNVYTRDGMHPSSMNAVRVGAVVRVFYSYTFGIRHPNAIFIIQPASK